MTSDYLQIVVYTFPIFLFSLSVHEAAHAISAYWGGDQTAAYQGRITLNPLSHIDLVGTIIIPLLAPMFGIPLIGWAKPVPVNSLNFRRGDSYDVVVAMAGPFSNLLLALLAVILYQFFILAYFAGLITSPHAIGIAQNLFFWMVHINILLMFFNLMPIPPLDGSWLVWHFWAKNSPKGRAVFEGIRSYGMIFLLILLWTGAIGAYFTWVVKPISAQFFNLAVLPVHFLN